MRTTAPDRTGDTYFTLNYDTDSMGSECYYCRGIVLANEDGDILLDDHADHHVYMHKRCGESHDVIEELTGATSAVEVTCPECGAVETR